MMKKKRYKFQVDLCLDELTEVSYSKAILFAKIRQLDGGSFTDVSRRYVNKSLSGGSKSQVKNPAPISSIIQYSIIIYFSMEVQNHCVKYSARFSFPCKMNANANSGILETCKCRISIRMVRNIYYPIGKASTFQVLFEIIITITEIYFVFDKRQIRRKEVGDIFVNLDLLM